MRKTSQMRNSFGPSKIYLKAILFTFLGIFMPVGALVATWFAWHFWEGWERYCMVAFLVAFAGLGLWGAVTELPRHWRDAFGGTTTLTGHVTRKWFTEKSGAAGYGQTARWKEFHIAVNDQSFGVSRRIHDWLSQGDEVVVHYWPRTEHVAKVEKF